MSNINLIKKHDFKFSKKFGQNFIFDTNLLKAIAQDGDIAKETCVLEIGAGSGSLTKILSNMSKKVFAFEIDNALKPVLEESLQGLTNVELIFKDILKQNTHELETAIGQNYTMVANLPYYITTPIIFKFVEQAQNIDKMVIMVQKEVAERLVSKHNTKEYGQITVTLNAIADIKITRIVNRQMFTPAPNVDSAIVKIEFNKNKFSINNKLLFNKIVKSAFAMRRKTLPNNLKNDLGLTSEQIVTALNSLNLNSSIRGEALSVQNFVDLSNLLNDMIN